MGRGQVVRQWILVPQLGDLNPSVPEHIYMFYENIDCFFNNVLFKIEMLAGM